MLQTLHYIPSSERNCFGREVGGEDVFNSSGIINTLYIQAEQKLFAIPTEICFYKMQVPPQHSSSVCIRSYQPSKSLHKQGFSPVTHRPAGQGGGCRTELFLPPIGPD